MVLDVPGRAPTGNRSTKSVCILAAGSGTRMGPYATWVHKALLPVRDVAAISHIVMKFEEMHGAKTPFVVAVGYRSQDVIDYLTLAHPRSNFTFVHVPDHAGPGSGPGASLLACRDHLKDAFYFVCCDTLWATLLVPQELADKDWIAVAHVLGEETPAYCNALVQENEVSGFLDKALATDPGYKAFTGLAHISSGELFFRSLAEAAPTRSLELAAGFEGLLRKEGGKGLFAAEMKGWLDLGTYERYETAAHSTAQAGSRKYGELFFHVNGRVIKFFQEPKIVAQRVARAKILQGAVPPVAGQGQNLFAYDFVPGEVLKDCVDPQLFTHFLCWLEKNLWHPKPVPAAERRARGLAFYRDKTRARMDLFFARDHVSPHSAERRKAEDALAHIPWDDLADVIPVGFHGDLQFDNVIHRPGPDRFTLIDWRQDFGGSIEWGDLYYELAKLQAGILFNLRDACPNPTPEILTGVLHHFMEKRNLDCRRLDSITALIFLNMAGLHHAPACHTLFREGLKQLSGLHAQLARTSS